MSAPSYLGMSDDDFMKSALPDEEPAQEAPVTETQTTEEPAAEQVAEPVEQEVASPVTEEAPVVEPETKAVEPKVEPETGTKEEKPLTQDEKPASTPDYEGFYKQIMAPFKANGKTIELRSPEEVTQMLQMGANYTRKMQELAPHRKVLLMLENNGLLDEGKLSYLIDLDKKNPEAVKKLVKDAGLDPMEIDTTIEPAYREGNHRVTDEEAVFRSALDDMKSNPKGLETLTVINGDWDQASKDLLWKSPEVLDIIHQQRESGIYDRIVTELNRQKVLGGIAPGVPFLNAYKVIGEDLMKRNAFADLVPQSAAPAQPAVVTTRVETPKAAVTNNDKAAAAASTRSAPTKSKEFINPLNMKDDDFIKMMADRV